MSDLSAIEPTSVTSEALTRYSEELEKSMNHFAGLQGISENAKADFESSIDGTIKINELKFAHKNEDLEDYVAKSQDQAHFVAYKNRLVQKTELIYKDPDGFFSAHYYAPTKVFFGQRISTLSANVIFIWLMTAGLSVLLAFDGLRKFLQLFGRGGKKKNG